MKRVRGTLVTLSSIHMLSVKRGQALISGLLALPTLASLWLRQLVPAVGLSQQSAESAQHEENGREGRDQASLFHLSPL